MHWGCVCNIISHATMSHVELKFPRTWILTTEPIMEPPEQLRLACELAGVPEGDFVPCGLGETRVY